MKLHRIRGADIPTGNTPVPRKSLILAFVAAAHGRPPTTLGWALMPAVLIQWHQQTFSTTIDFHGAYHDLFRLERCSHRPT